MKTTLTFLLAAASAITVACGGAAGSEPVYDEGVFATLQDYFDSGETHRVVHAEGRTWVNLGFATLADGGVIGGPDSEDYDQ